MDIIRQANEIVDNMPEQNSWGVYVFDWGTAVKDEITGRWDTIVLAGTGQTIDISMYTVQLHENGIEFVGM